MNNNLSVSIDELLKVFEVEDKFWVNPETKNNGYRAATLYPSFFEFHSHERTAKYEHTKS
jgi:hypothetical protein